MSSKVLKMGTELCKKRSVEVPIITFGRLIGCTKDMCEAFWQHFENLFTKEPGLFGKEFHSYLVYFPQLLLTEVASCDGEITDGELALSSLRDLVYPTNCIQGCRTSLS